MKRHALFLVLAMVTMLCAAGPIPPARAQEMPKEYQEVLNYLDRKGDFSANVLKVNIPRNDLHVTVSDVPTPTPFGFGGWVAMTKGTGGKEVMMGDLVLLQGEVWPVMSALLDHGLEVTALHNHFFWEDPRIFYMHIHGYGDAVDLAHRLKPALEFIGPRPVLGAPPPPASTPATSQGALDTQKLVRIVGHKGEQSGSVYKITIGRDDLTVNDMGATINARMGLNTWAAFVGTNEQAAIAGDVAMLESEVTPVLKVLIKHNLTVVAIHHHMTGVRPVVIFLHYWGQGRAEDLAAGFRAVLDELGKGAGVKKKQH